MSGPSKNDRPVRVYAAPGPSMPKRAGPTPSSRVTSSTAREPMCFSSHTTDATPSPAKCANASAGCSNRPSCAVVSVGAIVGGR